MKLTIPIFMQLTELPARQAPQITRKRRAAATHDGRRILSDHDVNTMRFMKSEGYTTKQISAEFPDVSQKYVYQIVNNLERTTTRNHEEEQ